MSDQIALILSKLVFGGSILLIMGVVYREWKLARISAEENKIKLAEKENEDLVNDQSDPAVVDSINKIISGQSGGSNKPE